MYSIEHGSAPSARGTTARDVLWFNWPAFALTALVAACALGATGLRSIPRRLRAPVAGIGVAGVYGLVSASLASWWVFDRSGITRWRWLPGVLPATVEEWVNITTGFDDTSWALVSLLAPATGRSIDLFDRAAEHDGPILRARSLRPPPPQSLQLSAAPLPLASSSVDAVFLLMAAHELRNRSARLELFAEIGRILRPAGRLVVVEHLRDVPNVLAFGPGALHFYSAGTWIEDGQAAALRLVERRRFAPFVSAFVFERGDAA